MEVEYYKLDDKELFETLKVDTNGLTGEEAKKRLEIYGSNVIKEKKKRSLILRFIDNFIHLFAIILWIAAGLCFIPRVNMPQ
ncbi:MAG TPA: cation-transporting P-type ATPase, partial [Candidatus Hydromicrobium sp.]